MIREFQPTRGAFLFRRITTAVWVAGLLSLGLLVLPLFGIPWLVLLSVPVLWLGIVAPAAFAAMVAYRKEGYELHSDHLVCTRGGVLSDGRTELDVRNITHVRLRLPWIRHWLFKIGDVRVESAGSSDAEITFESVLEPEELYLQVQHLMRENGYSLKQETLLHEESPTVVGALTDVVQAGIGLSVTGIFMASIALGTVVDLLSGGLSGMAVGAVTGLVVLASILAGLSGLVVRYLDVTRRTYSVYEDVVVYTEGFLTRDNALIPYENIADASSNRTVWDQVLGLYDITVSCQGSGSEVLFRRLSRGEELQQSLRTLVTNAGTRKRTLEDQRQAKAADPEHPDTQPIPAAQSARQLVAPEDAWTGEFKMHLVRALVGTLPALLVPPVWLLAAAAAAVRTTTTTYKVGPSSLSESYTFIGSRHTEFAYDKVTGVQITRSPLDRFFNTVTVEIWSIGAPKPLKMAHVLEEQLNLGALMRQCGIGEPSDSPHALAASFSVAAWSIARIPLVLGLLTLAVGLAVSVLLLGPLVLLAIPLLLVLPLPGALIDAARVKRQSVLLHPEHLELYTGVLWRKRTLVRYGDIKKVETTQIPTTNLGSLKLYVAGERVIQTDQGTTQVPNTIQAVYLENVDGLVDALDAVMLGRVQPEAFPTTALVPAETLHESRPALGNDLAPLLLVGIVLPPLWLLLPLVAWQNRVRRYQLDPDRVVLRGGIFFKRITSILYAKIDSLQQNQGALGKAFGNGKVVLMTAGSSAPDLVVANVADYAEVYAIIRKHYGASKD